MKYLIGILLIVVGFGGSLYFGISSAASDTANMQRFEVPGGADVELTAGSHTLYYETQSILDGYVYRNTEGATNISCNIAGPGEPSEILMETSMVKSSYTVGGYQGESVFSLTVPADGVYTIMCDKAGEPAVVAIGTGSGSFVMFIMLGILCFFGGLAMLIMAVIQTIRGRATS